jgi:hypothetical protein
MGSICMAHCLVWIRCSIGHNIFRIISCCHSSKHGQIRSNLYNFLRLLNEPTAVPYVFQESAVIDILIRLSTSLSIMSTTYISGLSHYHKLNDLQDNTESFIIKKLLEGMRRKYPQRRTLGPQYLSFKPEKRNFKKDCRRRTGHISLLGWLETKRVTDLCFWPVFELNNLIYKVLKFSLAQTFDVGLTSGL